GRKPRRAKGPPIRLLSLSALRISRYQSRNHCHDRPQYYALRPPAAWRRAAEAPRIRAGRDVSDERTGPREGLFQRGQRPGGDLFHAAGARYAVIGRRGGITAGGPFRVVLDEGARLCVIDLEPLAHGVLAIVIALNEGLA